MDMIASAHKLQVADMSRSGQNFSQYRRIH